jgi:hypothetical protein
MPIVFYRGCSTFTRTPRVGRKTTAALPRERKEGLENFRVIPLTFSKGRAFDPNVGNFFLGVLIGPRPPGTQHAAPAGTRWGCTPLTRIQEPDIWAVLGTIEAP